MASSKGRLIRLIRQFKGTYVLNNLLNAARLQHNRELYKKFGLRKSIYSPIGHQDFQETHPDIPWLDRPDAMEQLTAHPKYQGFSSEVQEELRRFVKEGYMILRGFFPSDDIQAANEQIDQLLNKRQIDYNYTGRKIMQSYKVAPVVDKRFFRRRELLDLLSFIMGRRVIPFQTINFIEGSEQRAHSDFIHMTTEPQGYLIACWVALEPIHKGNGPLFYYPGSHRLPYLMCEDYPSGNTRFTIGKESNKRYEDAVAKMVEESDLERETFTAEPGDMLIWHANLLHGGCPITQDEVTRKSLVAHYFCENVICYHEMTQRPALLDLSAL